MNCILIKNGRVIDPANNIDKICDLRIENGKIAELGNNLSDGGADVIDASGLLVTPGLIDMTLYGDLALSVIDELPPGRIPVKTHHYPEGRRNLAYEGLRRQLALGRQAYIVYPLVEETENSDLLAATEASVQLAAHFPDARIGLLHGRMKQADKDLVMQEFRSHQLDILVATTVIEVGVDVANATIMIIEHAKRIQPSAL